METLRIQNQKIIRPLLEDLDPLQQNIFQFIIKQLLLVLQPTLHHHIARIKLKISKNLNSQKNIHMKR